MDTYMLLTLSQKKLFIENRIKKQKNLEVKLLNNDIMGFSDAEYSKFKKLYGYSDFSFEEMEPPHKVNVEDFLVTRTPIINSYLGRKIDYKGFNIEENDYIAYVKKDVVDKLCEVTELRLPYETEWEYMIRAGKQDLFAFGNKIPSDLELEKWFEFNMKTLNKSKPNRLGLYAIFSGDWCGDLYSSSYADKKKTDDYVIRGGGAFFWPWQDNEWIWCLSAMRMPSKDLIDGECAFRLVMPLE